MRGRTTVAAVAITIAPVLAPAQGPGFGSGMMGGGGMAGAMAGGPGMLVVADDGSLLVTEVGSGTTMMGGNRTERALVRIGSDGAEVWRAIFDDGWPMRPVTDGDLVVMILRDDWFMGFGGTGDGSFGGGDGHRHGDDPDGAHADRSLLVALDLETGGELWRLDLEGDMVAAPQFAPDGERIYITVRHVGDGDGMGPGPITQGDAVPSHMRMATTVVALDRSGTELWRLDLADAGMGGAR